MLLPALCSFILGTTLRLPETTGPWWHDHSSRPDWPKAVSAKPGPNQDSSLPVFRQTSKGVEIQWTCFEVKGNDFDVDLVTVEVGLIERLWNTTDDTVGASNRVIQNLLLSITSADYLVCIIGIQPLCGYDETLHMLPPFLHHMKTCHAVSQLHAMEGILTIIMFTRKESCHRHHSNSWNVHYAQHNNTL